MAPRERFNDVVPGLVCPLCLSKSFTLVTEPDPKRGIMQRVYRCADCKSYFGDAREARGN